jgi:transposase-like protein
MKNRKHTPEQITRKLAEGEKLLGEGKSIEEVARHLEITEATWYRWRNQYGGMKTDDTKKAEGAGEGEPAPEANRCRPGSRHRHVEGAEPGKLLTPDCRRRPVVALQDQFGVTERRACRVVGQPRSTQRLKPPVPSDDELALRAFLRDFSRRRPRWGWRRAAVAAKQAGWRANHKRIHRFWIVEGLRVPYRKRKKPLRGIGQPLGAMCPIRPNVVWGRTQVVDATAPDLEVSREQREEVSERTTRS